MREPCRILVWGLGWRLGSMWGVVVFDSLQAKPSLRDYDYICGWMWG